MSETSCSGADEIVSAEKTAVPVNEAVGRVKRGEPDENSQVNTVV